MNLVLIQIDRDYILEEVARTTAYIGSKAITEQDKEAFERISTIQEDEAQLKRFYDEAIAKVEDLIKPFISSREQAETDEHIYEVRLNMPENYPLSLNMRINKNIWSFCVEYITGKWSMIANKAEANAYLQSAESSLSSAKTKLYTRQRPERKPITEETT